jgi:hypothetical protein
MWGAIIQAIFGLGKMGYGAYQVGNAKKLAKQNPFPDYTIPSEYYSNVGLAEREAQTGLSPETLAFLSQQNQQSLAASSNAILQGGGGINNIAQLYGQSNAQNAQLAQLNESLRLNKIQNLMEQKKELAGQKMYEWKLNQYDRWRDKAVAAAMMGAQGNKNIMGGIDSFGTGVANIGQNLSNSNTQNRQQEDTMGVMDNGRTQWLGGDVYNWDATGNPSVPSNTGNNSDYNSFNNIQTAFA